ncbi:MAG TPA: hypothetical protein VGC36_08060, partial [Rhizomicrobium sp.]
MSEVEALSVEEQLRAADRRAYLEQRLFVLSPFGTFATALLLFIGLFGLFVIFAEAEHVRLFTNGPQGFALESSTRMAFTIALILCTALFIQRYTRLRERADRAAFEAVLAPGSLLRRNLVQLTPSDARLAPFTALGVALGLVASWFLFGADMLALAHPPYATLAWFVVVNVALITAFARGLELSRTGSRASARAIEQDLIVDLL